jgi:hypothetical protein
MKLIAGNGPLRVAPKGGVLLMPVDRAMTQAQPPRPQERVMVPVVDVHRPGT